MWPGTTGGRGERDRHAQPEWRISMRAGLLEGEIFLRTKTVRVTLRPIQVNLNGRAPEINRWTLKKGKLFSGTKTEFR